MVCILHVLLLSLCVSILLCRFCLAVFLFLSPVFAHSRQWVLCCVLTLFFAVLFLPLPCRHVDPVGIALSTAACVL
jgi:hypothetical protein